MQGARSQGYAGGGGAAHVRVTRHMRAGRRCTLHARTKQGGATRAHRGVHVHVHTWTICRVCARTRRTKQGGATRGVHVHTWTICWRTAWAADHWRFFLYAVMSRLYMTTSTGRPPLRIIVRSTCHVAHRCELDAGCVCVWVGGRGARERIIERGRLVTCASATRSCPSSPCRSLRSSCFDGAAICSFSISCCICITCDRNTRSAVRVEGGGWRVEGGGISGSDGWSSQRRRV